MGVSTRRPFSIYYLLQTKGIFITIWCKRGCIVLCTFADLRRPINLTDFFRFTTHDLLFLSLFPFIFKHWSTTFFILTSLNSIGSLSLSFSFMKRRLACFPLIRSMQKQICLPHLWRSITWRTKIRTFSKWPPNWRKRKFVVNSFWPISLKFYLLKIPVCYKQLKEKIKKIGVNFPRVAL